MSSVGKILVAGSGFLADAYSLYIIGLAQTVIFEVYPPSSEHVKDQLKSLISTAALIGAVFGQLFFGNLADRIGRKRVFVCTGSLITVAAVLSACAQKEVFKSWGQDQIFWQIAFFQLVIWVLVLVESIHSQPPSPLNRRVLPSGEGRWPSSSPCKAWDTWLRRS
mmetsp:Transcript_21030/g.45542  ORF Transcript_21030/g.45542 Transcript_21030/m.45542 type:complete len:165 (-) Transcript_21030:1475-1969(-)